MNEILDAKNGIFMRFTNSNVIPMGENPVGLTLVSTRTSYFRFGQVLKFLGLRLELRFRTKNSRTVLRRTSKLLKIAFLLKFRTFRERTFVVKNFSVEFVELAMSINSSWPSRSVIVVGWTPGSR